MCRVLAVLLLCVFMLPVHSAPRSINHPLTEFTELTLKVVPDLGTRLVFPFVLDNPAYQPPVVRTLTNGGVFSEHWVPAQNTVVLTVNTPEQGGQLPRYLGNYFVSVNGFNVSIQLETTSQITEHVTDVVLTLTNAQRDHLIDATIKRRAAEVEAAYQDKLKDIERRAERRALALVGSVAVERPRTVRIKEQDDLTTEEGAAIRYYADVFLVYERFAILDMEIRNLSPYRLAMRDFQLLYTASDEGSKQEIAGALDCPQALEPDARARCTYTIASHTIHKDGRYTFALLTDRGQVELTW